MALSVPKGSQSAPLLPLPTHVLPSPVPATLIQTLIQTTQHASVALQWWLRNTIAYLAHHLQPIYGRVTVSCCCKFTERIGQ